MTTYRDLDWIEDAACREYPVDLFFPEEGQSYTDARTICAACPVITDCLAYIDDVETGALGIPTSYSFGLFGGLSPRQRDERRAAQQGDAA